MKNYVVRVENDLFDIANRIKAIDEDLFVCFNCKSHRFELHNSRFKNSFQLQLPFDRLDCRTLDYAFETHIKNRKALMEATDRFNLEVEKRRNEQICASVLQSVQTRL